MTVHAPFEPAATSPPLALSAGRRRTLDAICDTLAPGGDGLPSATELGVPEAVLEAVARAPRAADRRAFALALSALGSRRPDREGAATPGAGRGRARARAAVVVRQRAPVPPRRVPGAAARGARHVPPRPGPGGGPNPAWEAMGYGGPLGRLPGSGARTLQPLPVDGDTVIDCDVCVVGSGAGGGTAAAVLASRRAGRRRARGRRRLRRRGLRRRRARGLPAAVRGRRRHGDRRSGHRLLAGSCLGGGTTVNYTTSFRPPDDVRAEWAGHGRPGVRGRRVRGQPGRRLGAPRRQHAATAIRAARDRIFLRGLDALGWHAEPMPRNVEGCDSALVRLVRLWLPRGGQALDGQDVAGRRPGRRRPHPRRDAGRARARARRRRARRAGAHRRRPRGRSARPRRRGGGRGLPDARAAAPLRARQPQPRPPPAPASGHRRVRRVRRAGARVGRHAGVAVLRRARPSRRRLRRQVRDRRDPPEPDGVRRAVARRGPVPAADGRARAHAAARDLPARPRRGRGPRRSRRASRRPLPALGLRPRPHPRRRRRRRAQSSLAAGGAAGVHLARAARRDPRRPEGARCAPPTRAAGAPGSARTRPCTASRARAWATRRATPPPIPPERPGRSPTSSSPTDRRSRTPPV